MQIANNLFPARGLTHRFHGSRVHYDLSLPALRQEGSQYSERQEAEQEQRPFFVKWITARK